MKQIKIRELDSIYPFLVYFCRKNCQHTKIKKTVIHYSQNEKCISCFTKDSKYCINYFKYTFFFPNYKNIYTDSNYFTVYTSNQFNNQIYMSGLQISHTLYDIDAILGWQALMVQLLFKMKYRQQGAKFKFLLLGNLAMMRKMERCQLPVNKANKTLE